MPTASAVIPEPSHLTIRDTWSEFTVLAVVTGLYEHCGAIGLLSLIICDRHTETVDTEPSVNPEALLGSERCLFVCDLAYRVLDDNSRTNDGPVVFKTAYAPTAQNSGTADAAPSAASASMTDASPAAQAIWTTATSPTTEGTWTTDASPAAESARTPRKLKKPRHLPALPCLVPIKTEKCRQDHKHLKGHLKDVHGLELEEVQQYYEYALLMSGH